MGKCLKLLALVLGLSMAVGCASTKNGTSVVDKTETQRYHETHEAVADANQAILGSKLVKKAHTQIGTPYVLGGSKPGGFDCSGFVKWAYKEVGVQLPRTAREQSVVGKKITSVEDMRAGDIVAFRHPRNGYHTGIYVGDGKFIHSPRKRTTIRINSLDDSYYKSTFLSARRVSMDGSENLVAQAEDRLTKYAADRPASHTSAKKSKSNLTKQVKGKKSKNVIAVASKSKKKSHAVAAKSSKTTKTVAAKSSKKTQTVAANHTKSKALQHKIASGKNKNRQVAHNSAPVKGAAKHVAAKKNNHKAVSMLHQSKSGKRAGKNSRS